MLMMVVCKVVVAEKEELAEAESKDKLEIVKQIKKVNDDGSYTIGYEADDGSFKIESRDVQGNIKGTYGYVDDDGEVKRVSYSTTNTSEVVAKVEPTVSVVQRIPRVNKNFTTTASTTTTFSTPPTVVSSSTVVQSIPRRRVVPTTKVNLTDEVRIAPTVITAHQYSQRSTNQIARPEFATARSQLDEGIKPVTEQSEIHGNLLRRQTFDVQQHAANLRQAHGADAPDVYTASVTTGMPRPLFTTIRPSIDPTSSRYYHRNVAPEITTLSPSPTTQESSTTEAPQYTTPIAATPVQIPRNQVEPLVAIQHPYRGTIVVPLRELQAEAIPYGRTQPDPRTVPVYVRRPPVQVLRSMPVQVDENGYVRELRPIPYAPEPQYDDENNIEGEIEGIRPPVSVQDFQKLLNLLIARQRRLEQVNKLARQYESVYQPPAAIPYVVAKYQQQQRGPVQFVSPTTEMEKQNSQARFYNPYQTQYQQPSRRVARLLQPERNLSEDYLPPDVREMLLLRMLQLAINPALPVDDAETLGSATDVQMTRQPIRNVEILGEENDDPKRILRPKRLLHNTS